MGKGVENLTEEIVQLQNLPSPAYFICMEREIARLTSPPQLKSKQKKKN